MDANGLHISSLARLRESERNAILRQLTDAQADELAHDWRFLARPDQLAPDWAWQVWLFLAGRGSGKTRSGAEWVRAKVKSGCSRIALIAPTAADAREVMVDGESGILACAWARDKDYKGNTIGRPLYQPSLRRLTWENGAIATTYSAEEPDRLRGPQHDGAWCDELAAWVDPNDAWDMLMFGLRLGANPQAMVTTTPRPIPIIRELLTSQNTAVTKAKTSDNRHNLSPQFLSKIVAKYKGTRLGRQELDGEVIEQVEGALWTREWIEQNRHVGPIPELRRTVIGIDPAASSGDNSALTGIVACGVGFDGVGYVIADASARLSPAAWAKRAVEQYDVLKADRIVAEGNQGGEMVRHTLETERKNLPLRIVHARHAKQARAEPVSALSQQNRIKFCGAFPELEDQLCTWAPAEGNPSPDRLDAMVWAFTDLMLGSAQDIGFAKPIVVTGPLPGV